MSGFDVMAGIAEAAACGGNFDSLAGLTEKFESKKALAHNARIRAQALYDSTKAASGKGQIAPGYQMLWGRIVKVDKGWQIPVTPDQVQTVGIAQNIIPSVTAPVPPNTPENNPAKPPVLGPPPEIVGAVKRSKRSKRIQKVESFDEMCGIR